MVKGFDYQAGTKPKLVALGDTTMPADALAPDVATASEGMVLGV